MRKWKEILDSISNDFIYEIQIMERSNNVDWGERIGDPNPKKMKRGFKYYIYISGQDLFLNNKSQEF